MARTRSSSLSQRQLSWLSGTTEIIFTSVKFISDHASSWYSPAKLTYPKERDTNGGGKQARSEKDNLPRLENRAIFAAADCDTICEQSTEDLEDMSSILYMAKQARESNLSKAVKGEPNGGPKALFITSVPLRCEECKPRRDSSFEDTQEKPDRNSSSEVLDSREAGKNYSPHDDIESRYMITSQHGNNMHMKMYIGIDVIGKQGGF